MKQPEVINLHVVFTSPCFYLDVGEVDICFLVWRKECFIDMMPISTNAYTIRNKSWKCTSKKFCGITSFFSLNAKGKKSWNPFRICLLNRTANQVLFWTKWNGFLKYWFRQQQSIQAKVSSSIVTLKAPKVVIHQERFSVGTVFCGLNNLSQACDVCTRLHEGFSIVRLTFNKAKSLWSHCMLISWFGLWDHSFKTSANFYGFWPLPPYHRHSRKMLMKGIFNPYVQWPLDHRQMGTPLPLRHSDVLNEWSLLGNGWLVMQQNEEGPLWLGLIYYAC